MTIADRSGFHWSATRYVVVCIALMGGWASPGSGSSTWVSVREDGTPATPSIAPTLSDDGTLAAFLSRDPLLVAEPEDPNRTAIFVRNRAECTTERVSIATSGVRADDDAVSPGMSANGRFVTFFSSATNLVPNDGNDRMDVFLHDRSTAITERINVATDGAEADENSGRPGLRAPVSNDGTVVAFTSYATNLVPALPPLECPECVIARAFVRHRNLGTTTTLEPPAEGTLSTFIAGLSADGRVVAIASDTNAAPSDADLYLVDPTTGTGRLANRTQLGTRLRVSLFDQVALSADGCVAIFEFYEGDVLPSGLARFSCLTGAAKVLLPDALGTPAGLSPDARWLAHGLTVARDDAPPGVGAMLVDLSGQEAPRELDSGSAFDTSFGVSQDGRVAVASIDFTVAAHGRLPEVPSRCEQIARCDEDTGSDLDDILCIVTRASSEGVCSPVLVPRLSGPLDLIRNTIHAGAAELDPARARRINGRLGRQLKRLRSAAKRAVRRLEIEPPCGDQLIDAAKRSRAILALR
jgi:hypothetical protein